jgi:hypothetical protein
MEDPTTSPETTVKETASATATDLAELAAILPGDAAASARVADKLSEELAELGQMLRSLPGRPAAMSGHDYALVAALRTAHAAGEDIGETLARALARLAAELGGIFEVIKARPGSWEAALIAELLRGTVGPYDEDLPAYGPGAGGSLCP